MASERHTENSSEVVEKSKISESFQRLLQQDVALSKDARLCVSLPLISSSGNARNGNEGPTNQELVSDGMYHPSPSRFGYFAGSDGLYSNLQNQAYLTGQGAFEVPYSVNTSGQFVGLAQMIGPVDFTKSMDFWQQDKWHGFFPVKWHIVKDIPNSLFRDIILENNDNRAVTYSRDTQEIGLPQGLKILQIFKTFQMQTSILDDFGFYEKKQKSLHAQRRTSEHSRVVTNCDGNSSVYPQPGRIEFGSRSDGTPSFHKESLVTLTKNLSLNAHRQSSTD